MAEEQLLMRAGNGPPRSGRLHGLRAEHHAWTTAMRSSPPWQHADDAYTLVSGDVRYSVWETKGT